MDTAGSIAQGATRFFSGTMLSRITGMVRDVLMAACFGSHPSVAAFLMAFRFASLPRRLLAEGAMQSALVPKFEALRAEDPARAVRLIRDLAVILCLSLIVLLVLGEGVLFGWQAGLSYGNREVIRLTALMLPGLIFIVLYGIAAALLHCERRFFIPSVAPALFNLVWIITTLLLWTQTAERAMAFLAVALVFAVALQWLAVVPLTLRSLKEAAVGSLWSQLRPFSKDVRSLMKPLALGFLGVGAQQINSAFDPIFARAADSSGPAYLWYALRLQQLPLALIGLALAGALLPPLSRAVKNGDPGQYRQFLSFALEKGSTLMVPCTLAILATGLSAVNLLYGRGAFSLEATLHTARCLWAYGLGLVPMTAVFILAGACYAHQEFRIPALVSLCSVALNLGIDAWLVMGWGLGPYAVALATAASAWWQLAALAWVVYRKEWGTELSGMMIALGRTGAASVTAWVAVHIFTKTGLPREFWAQLIHFALQAALFAATWSVTIFLLGERFRWLRGVREKVADNRNIDWDR